MNTATAKIKTIMTKEEEIDMITAEFLERLEKVSGKEVYKVEWEATDCSIVYYCNEYNNDEDEEELTEEELSQIAQSELYRDEWSQYMEGKPALYERY
jgi:hypothetical protein